MSDRIQPTLAPSAERRGALVLAAALLLSFTLKLTVWAVLLPHSERFEERDSPLYDQSARALLHRGAFAPSPELAGVAETRRTPGYPAFLAGSYALFGERYSPVIVLQILISLGTMVLVYAVSRRVWGLRVAVLAVVLLLADVASFTSPLRIMSDTLFVFLTTAMLGAGAAVLLRPRKALPALAVGVLLTVATYVRPVSLYLVVPFALAVLLMAATRRWRWKTALAVLLAMVVPYVLGVGAWQVRNARLTGSSGFSGLEGFNLLYHRGARVVALRDGISLSEARSRVGLEQGFGEYSLESGWTPARDAVWRREATEILLDHPVLFVRSQLPGALRLLLAPGEGDLLRMLGIPVPEPSDAARYLERFSSPGSALLSAWAVLYLVVLYLGVLSWAWSRVSQRSVSTLDVFLWGVLLYFAVVSAGQGDSRYRLPMMPILVMYSAQGLVHAGQRLRDRRTPSRSGS